MDQDSEESCTYELYHAIGDFATEEEGKVSKPLYTYSVKLVIFGGGTSYIKYSLGYQ